MRNPAALRRVSGLTLAALWSSGTTYLLFVLYARKAGHDEVGQFVAISSLVLLATQILDGGVGLLMMREVASASDSAHKSALVRATFILRTRALLLTLPIVLVIDRFGFGLTDTLPLIIGAIYLITSTAYGFVVQVFQGRRQFDRVIALQSANGFLFVIGAGLVATLASDVSVVLMLTVPTLALTALAVFGGVTIRHDLVKRDATRPQLATRREVAAVRGGSIAAAVTGNVDQMLLGIISPATLAIYAGAQRAALGLAALSVALTNYLLPTAASGNHELHRRLLRATRRLGVVVPAAAFLLGWLISWPLALIYGDPVLAPHLTVALLVCAYAVGALSTLPVSVLYAHHRGSTIAAFISAQAVIVLGGCVIAAILRSPTGTAAVILLGKSFYLLAVTILAARDGGGDEESSKECLSLSSYTSAAR